MSWLVAAPQGASCKILPAVLSMQCTYRQAALSSAPHCPAWRSTRPAAQVEIAGHAVNNARARSRVLAASCTVTEAPAPAIADGSLPLHTVSLPVHTHTFKLVKPADVDAVIDWYIAQGVGRRRLTMCAGCMRAADCDL